MVSIAFPLFKLIGSVGVGLPIGDLGQIRFDMHVKVKNLCLILLGLLAAGLTLAGMENFSGSKPVYFLFSFFYWLMLITAFSRSAHFGYIFLAVMLWLGFWAKLTLHLILDYPFIEPVGGFVGSPTAWNEVLWVALLACLGVMVGRLIGTIVFKIYSRKMRCEQSSAPAWYPSVRIWLWLCSGIGIIGLAVVNVVLGLQQIGLVPRTILPWPMNALIVWQVTIGWALLMTVLLWWEVLLRKNIAAAVYAPIIEAFLSASSVLSRGILLFHSLPQLFALFENRKSLIGLSKAKVVVLIVFLGCSLIFVTSGVNTVRAHLYSEYGSFPTHRIFDDFVYKLGSESLNSILGLAVDRWIGLEGVMAIVAYPEKNLALLREAALEKRAAGFVTKFNVIANSHYQWIDTSKWRFASLPGPAAFLFFSGSLWVVLLGMALFVIVLQMCEQLVFKLATNPLLCSLTGFTMANTISRFGVAPRQDIPFYGMIACFVLFVHVLQSVKFNKMLQMLTRTCTGRSKL